MDLIREKVRRVRRRLSFELFLNRLLKCLFVTLGGAVVAIGVPKVWAIAELPGADLPGGWAVKCGIAGLGVGLVAAMVWTWMRGRTELEAAVEIDRRFGLKERVASSFSLSEEVAETPAGRALVADAVRAVGRIDVDEKFGVRWERRAWLPLVPALLAVVLTMFVDNREAQSGGDPKSPEISQKQQENAAKKLRERLANRRKEASKRGLKEAEGLFRELEKQAEKMAEVKGAGRKRSLVKINDLAKKLEQRRKQLGGESQLRKQLKKMNNLNKGPADKMVAAMRKGDWKGAQQELEKLRKKMAEGKFDKQAKRELEQQLKQLQEKMAAAQEARKEAMAELKKQIEQQKQQGNLSKAGELQQKLDQMQQQQRQQNKMDQLAQKMGECQQCMQKGDAQGAAAAMAQMMQQMEQMEREMAEGELLDAAMDQLQMAKDAMGCARRVRGKDVKACQGGGDQFSEKGGNGLGAGRGGFGPRPEEKNDVRFRDSRVRMKTGARVGGGGRRGGWAEHSRAGGGVDQGANDVGRERGG